MTTKAQPKLVTLKGHTRADQVTTENIEDFAKSLNGTVEGGMLSFEIHKWTHTVIPGDWIVVFMPSGDIQTYTDSMFSRIFECEGEV